MARGLSPELNDMEFWGAHGQNEDYVSRSPDVQRRTKSSGKVKVQFLCVVLKHCW